MESALTQLTPTPCKPTETSLEVLHTKEKKSQTGHKGSKIKRYSGLNLPEFLISEKSGTKIKFEGQAKNAALLAYSIAL